jgi:hypothetical protein
LPPANTVSITADHPFRARFDGCFNFYLFSKVCSDNPRKQVKRDAMREPGDISTEAEGNGQEDRLLEQLRRLEGSREGRIALIWRLSRLRPHHRRPQHVRIAARVLDPLVTRRDARMYVLGNNDLVLLCSNVSDVEIDSAVSRMRNLFKGDPLVLQDDGAGDGGFVGRYDLASQFGDFHATIRAAIGAPAAETAAATARPMTPEVLDAVWIEARRIGFDDLIGQQTAIEVGVGGEGRILFREHFVSIDDLQRRVAPDVDLKADPWLFQHLTELLDRRLLSAIGRWDFAGLGQPVSVNLNVGTVLQPHFQAFDKAVGDAANNVIIEFQQTDVFADMGTFVYVRDRLRQRRYRVLVDGLSPLSLQFFDPGLLGADFYKVYWSEAYIDSVPDRARAEIRDLTASIGRKRVVMARVDSEQAIRFGLSLGIQLFQGRYIDRLVADMAARLGQPVVRL